MNAASSFLRVYPIPSPADLERPKPEQAAYGNGYAAGETWALELATFVDLEQLEEAARQPWFVAAPWIRGFVDGALRTWRDMGETRYCSA